ncbi:MAG: hypothetical protein ACT4OF_09385 [Caulobacteraceae bacterium]
MRAVLFALAALTAACSPPTTTSETPEPPATPSADATTQALVTALTPVVSQEIGQPVSLQATNVNVRDEWAFITAQPRKPDGSAIDWSTTALAQRAADGVLDGDGTTYALLKNENGTWTVLEHAIGPTDVAWIEWASEHGVPADILGQPSN